MVSICFISSFGNFYKFKLSPLGPHPALRLPSYVIKSESTKNRVSPTLTILALVNVPISSTSSYHLKKMSLSIITVSNLEPL